MIKRFSVTNFKSIDSVSVDFSEVTVLVGRSGTGKSNFLHSIRFLRELIVSDKSRKEFNLHVPVPKQTQNWLNKRMRFEIEFSVGLGRPLYEYHLEVFAESTIEEKLSYDGKTLFHLRRPISEDALGPTEWVVQPNIVGAEKPPKSLAIRQYSGIHEVVVAYSALSTGIGIYDFGDSVLTNLERPLAVGSQGLVENASNYIAVMRDMALDLRDFTVRTRMVDALKRINSNVTSVELDNIVNPTKVFVGHGLGDKVLTLNLSIESVGFRRFYAHLLALYQKPPKLCLLFEHPEDGVHPGAMALLAEEFKAAPLESRGQVVFTTHNPRLLDQFDVESIRVVDLDGFSSTIGPVSSEQKDAIEDDLLDTGELLTSDPARLDKE